MDKFQPLAMSSLAMGSPQPRLIATDMDGTLTHQGKFTAALLQGLERLQGAGFPVLIVTGRSAGWVNGLAHYLPVTGAMAENGGIYFPGALAAPQRLAPIPDLVSHRQHLGALFTQLQQRWPQLQESEDNSFRLTDWTFDVGGLSQGDLDQMRQVCEAQGWGFTYSTVQCHLFTAGQCKATGLKQVLTDHFPRLTPAEVITIGDSPNDESLFNQEVFPHSVGVANVKEYWSQLAYRPTYVTQAPAVDGFLEVVKGLLSSPTTMPTP